MKLFKEDFNISTMFSCFKGGGYISAFSNFVMIWMRFRLTIEIITY